jgi:hypothetical protein
MEEEVNTKSDARSQTETHRITRYIWKKNVKQSRIRGSHGGEYEDGCLLGCSAV